MTAHRTKALVLHVPEFFQDSQFMAWLNSTETVFTWHQKGTPPHDCSDVVVLVDPSLNGEGSDSDMPKHFWDAIVTECRKQFEPAAEPTYHIMVWLQNCEG